MVGDSHQPRKNCIDTLPRDILILRRTGGPYHRTVSGKTAMAAKMTREKHNKNVGLRRPYHNVIERFNAWVFLS